MSDGMVFYRSFWEAVKELDAGLYKECVEAILRYGLDGEMSDVAGVAKTVLTLVKPQIDANNKRRENGKRGGIAKAKNAKADNSGQVAKCSNDIANSKQVVAKEKDKVKDKVKDKDNINILVQAQEDADIEFCRFWAAYPKKQDKKTARAKFDKIIKSGVSVETIINAVVRQMNTEQWKKDGGRYIPMPSTWLNQERWNDEVVTTSRPTNASKNGFLSFEQHGYDVKELARRAKE